MDTKLLVTKKLWEVTPPIDYWDVKQGDIGLTNYILTVDVEEFDFVTAYPADFEGNTLNSTTLWLGTTHDNAMENVG